MKKIEFRDLGQKSYNEIWSLQQELQEQVIKDKLTSNPSTYYTLLVEHFPVYTLGRNGNKENILFNINQLSSKKAEVIKVDRGGDITFHGIGQLVAYPIIDLEAFRLGIKEYVYCLEETVIQTISHYEIKGKRVKGATGVWIGNDSSNEKKICAIGIKCSRYVTMHGLALNVNTDLDYFNYINPCGFINKGVTSINKETTTTISMDEIKSVFIQKYKKVFGI